VAVGRAPAPRLLVLRALGLGDLLTAVPALRALAAAFGDHRRLLAMPSRLAPLLRLLGDGGAPAFDVLDARPLRELGAVAQQPDVAVNLHGRGPQSHAILAAARPRRMIAFAHPAVPGHEGPRWERREHEVDRWCRLLAESGIPADPADRTLRPPALRPPRGTRGATILHPGAASPARRWPPARWVAVARAERGAGRRVIVTGSGDERALALAVADAAGIPRDDVLAGATDLLGLAALVAAAGRVVCGDTGVAHLASAFGTPSVLLFGPTPPAEWGPPQDPRHRVLWAGLTGDPHGDRPDPGLLAITPARVLDELRRLDRLPA
jgi:ADP-heptose:LPS heptosyltransferase